MQEYTLKQERNNFIHDCLEQMIEKKHDSLSGKTRKPVLIP